MKAFEEASPSRRVTIVLTGGGSTASADIVDELPELGDTYGGRTVLEVTPYPLTWTEQKVPDVWQYAIWYIHLQGNVWRYLAIHEAEAEKI